MRNIFIFILIVNINFCVKAQPTYEMIDIMRGSVIEFNEVLCQDSVLVIDNWLVNQSNSKSELYILQKKANNNISNPFSSFSVKRSEIDNTYRFMYFVFGDNLMTVKVLKNKAHLTIKIKKINFTTGTYILDLEQLSHKYGKKGGVEIDEFPFLN